MSMTEGPADRRDRLKSELGRLKLNEEDIEGILGLVVISIYFNFIAIFFTLI
jgi:hypothetical protein